MKIAIKVHTVKNKNSCECTHICRGQFYTFIIIDPEVEIVLVKDASKNENGDDDIDKSDYPPVSSLRRFCNSKYTAS